MSEIVKLSTLNKTWILDLDGTIVKHNGYITDGYDTLLGGAKEFLDSIPDEDMVIFITSRTEEYSEKTKDFLRKNEIRFDHIIFGAPYGERILINDKKVSGLSTAVAINTERNIFSSIGFEIDKSL